MDRTGRYDKGLQHTVPLRSAMAGILTVGALCLSAQPPGAEFRDPLEGILRASKEQFRKIEGARVENRRRDYYYESRIYLPGAQYCEILILKAATLFHCEWKKAAARADLSALFDKLGSTVEQALGPDWSRKAATRKSGKETAFTRAGEPVIQVIAEPGESLVHTFISPAGSSPDRVGEDLPKRPPFILP